MVFDELHRIAHRYMTGEHNSLTLQTSGLVNEAFMRLVDVKEIDWRDRAHFFAISATLMRQILVDFARSRRAQKRGEKQSAFRFRPSETSPTGTEQTWLHWTMPSSLLPDLIPGSVGSSNSDSLEG